MTSEQSGSDAPARASEFGQRQMEAEEESVIRSKESEEIEKTQRLIACQVKTGGACWGSITESSP